MKLSIFDQSPVSSSSTHREQQQLTIKLAEAADAWGFTRHWIAEHLIRMA